MFSIDFCWFLEYNAGDTPKFAHFFFLSEKLDWFLLRMTTKCFKIFVLD